MRGAVKRGAMKKAAKRGSTRRGAVKQAATAKHATSADGAPTHVALLRAINLGGRTVVKMADLKLLFEKHGARAVRTILASGNVLFAADDAQGCAARVSAALSKKQGRAVPIMVRSLDAVRALVAARPYGAPMPPAGTTWYVSFLDAAPGVSHALPHLVPTGDVTYLELVGLELCASVTPLPGKTSVENFKVEQLFKVGATVRTWNTVLRLIAE